MSKPKHRRAPEPSRVPWIIGGVVVVIAIALVVALVSGGGSKKSNLPDRAPAPPALVNKVTSVPSSVFETVGIGTTTRPPQAVNGTPLIANGKSRILYIGAEYCPYCATERWPMVIALSKFGTFTSLQTTNSASDDVFPDTATFSFYGATYTSKYVQFEPVETATRTRAPLETPTPEQLAIQKTYDPKQYIPFVQFGGKYMINGATYDAAVLQGKTHDEIATALSDPNSDVAKGAIGASNTIIAAICKVTNNQPANVCRQPVIKSIESQLG